MTASVRVAYALRVTLGCVAAQAPMAVRVGHGAAEVGNRARLVRVGPVLTRDQLCHIGPRIYRFLERGDHRARAVRRLVPTELIKRRLEPQLKRLRADSLDMFHHLAPMAVGVDQLLADAGQRPKGDSKHNLVEVPAALERERFTAPGRPIRLEVDALALERIALDEL